MRLFTPLTDTRTTPFYRAVRGGSFEVVELLYNAGSDVNITTWDNFTPILEATDFGYLDLVQQLLRWGASPLVEILGGVNALKVARLHGFTDIVSAMQQHLKSKGRFREARKP